MLNGPHSKPVTHRCIPISQQKDLRRIILEIVSKLAPFTVTVCEVFVDYGGYFSATLLLGFQPEFHSMKLACRNQHFCQPVLRSGIGPLWNFNQQFMP